MRLLIVEDDPRLRSNLAKHFREQHWVVDEAQDGREGSFHANERLADIAIVDLGLPDISGVDLIRSWRKQGHSLPILILTARADWQDKVAGLEAGADDYVTKPFYLEEVEARLHVLLRRAEGRRSPIADYGMLRIDFAGQRVWRGDDLVTLTSHEFNTLAALARQPGTVLSRTDIMDQLYDHDQDRDSNVIEVFIGRLRKKLFNNGDSSLIETVRGAGYRFNGERQNP